MVEGAFTVNESVLTSRSSFEDGAAAGASKSGLADDTIKVLLGDEWRAGARKILADARTAVEGAGGTWSAAQLNTLNESLKVRIDRTLDDWLVEMMNSRIDDLRSATAGDPRKRNRHNLPAHSPTKSNMESSFDPHAIEQSLYREWESAGNFEPRGNGKPYCIMIPPPNVTGSLHMGHAFQHTIMDTLIRYRRMKGDRTLWQMGTDHAGISTQMLVERQLNARGVTKAEIGREAFIEKVWEWKAASGGRISEQMRRMGSSLDWSRERFTMDEGFSRAVREAFVRLYDEGLIYRGRRLVNWDPELKTAISDLEVESTEEQGSLWHFRYPLCDGARTSDGRDYVVVATTRPETMLGDTAVAVHPDDERYTGLVGKRVRLPLAEREIPIIADTYVDPTFGSGCVKITPAHDFNDYAVGERHNLPMINIFTVDAHLNEAVPAAYRGLDRTVARKRIVADLTAAGLIDKIEDHKLMVPRGDRSDAIIEPSADGPVVRRDRCAGQTRHRSRAARRHRVRAQTVRKPVFRLDARRPRLVHQPATMVGPSDSGVVRRKRRHLRRARRSRGAPQIQTRGRCRADGGRRRARNVVFVGDVDVRHARLAGPDARTRDVSPDRRARHRPRHHLLLGRPDDHDDVALHGSGAVPQGSHDRPGARRRRPEDVEDARQRARSAGRRRRHLARRPDHQAHRGADAAADGKSHRKSHASRLPRRHSVVRHRRVALRVLRVRVHRARCPLRSETYRGLPQFLQQTVERDEVRVDEHGRRIARRSRGRNARRPLDRLAPETNADRFGTRDRNLPFRPARQLHLRLRMARILRLVPRTDEAAAVGRRRQRRDPAGHPALAVESARNAAARRPSDHSVHHGSAVAPRCAPHRNRWRDRDVGAVSGVVRTRRPIRSPKPRSSGSKAWCSRSGRSAAR